MADFVIESKPPEPTEQHWLAAQSVAELATRTAAARFGGVSQWDEEDIISSMLIRIMYHYKSWNPERATWSAYAWVCSQHHSMDAIRRLFRKHKRECYNDFDTTIDQRTDDAGREYIIPELVFGKLNGLHQWVVRVRTAFGTARECHEYLRLCGMTENQIKLANRQINNATVRPYRADMCRRGRANNRDTELLARCLERERSLTRTEIGMIMMGQRTSKQPYSIRMERTQRRSASQLVCD